jgi:N utilization substance protein B
MTLPKEKLREAVLQILYSWEITTIRDEEILPLLMEQLKTTRKNMQDAWERAKLIWNEVTFINERIHAASQEYAFDRISKVDLAILRLASFEILLDKEIPEKVAIAEGIRLSRKFSSPEASEFVQALLNEVLKYDATASK